MLNTFFASYEFIVFCKCGFYIDFFFKKIAEVCIRNIFIYSAQFFGEKYIIEVFTKKIFFSSIFFLNKFIGFTSLNVYIYFVSFLSFMFYFLSIINILLLF